MSSVIVQLYLAVYHYDRHSSGAGSTIPVACSLRTTSGSGPVLPALSNHRRRLHRPLSAADRKRKRAGRGISRRRQAGECVLRSYRQTGRRQTHQLLHTNRKKDSLLDDSNKRKDSFVHIGRASAFIRIGWGRENGNVPDLKRANSFIRIGKSSEEPSDGSAIEVDTTGNENEQLFCTNWKAQPRHGEQRKMAPRPAELTSYKYSPLRIAYLQTSLTSWSSGLTALSFLYLVTGVCRGLIKWIQCRLIYSSYFYF